ASSPEESPEQPRDGTAAEDTGAEDPAAEDTGAEDGEDDSDAVEVEGMHLPTPVAVTEPAEEPKHPEEPETPAADETPAAAEDSETPGATGRITPAAQPDQSEPDQPEPDEPESGQPARGNDHDTQEITPLVEDDTDDVIDPSR